MNKRIDLVDEQTYTAQPFSCTWKEPGNQLRWLLLSICIVVSGCGEIERNVQGRSYFSYRLLTAQPPVSLDATTLEQFAKWASTASPRQTDDIIRQIELVTDKPAVIDAIASHLSFASTTTVDDQLTYLSILGQLKHDRATIPLEKYVYSLDCLVFEELRDVQGTAINRSMTSMLDVCAMVKAHAVNMIAYIDSATAQQVVLGAIARHPSRFVRISAMNAFLFNSGDSAIALDTVRRYARVDEQIFVGLPRLDSTISLQEFNQKVHQFYIDHPEQMAKLPRGGIK